MISPNHKLGAPPTLKSFNSSEHHQCRRWTSPSASRVSKHPHLPSDHSEVSNPLSRSRWKTRSESWLWQAESKVSRTMWCTQMKALRSWRSNRLRVRHHSSPARLCPTQWHSYRSYKSLRRATQLVGWATSAAWSIYSNKGWTRLRSMIASGKAFSSHSIRPFSKRAYRIAKICRAWMPFVALWRYRSTESKMLSTCLSVQNNNMSTISSR